MKKIISVLLILLLLLGLFTPFALATTFHDVPQNMWFTPYVTWANRNGIMQGTGGGNFSPNQPMSRGQLVTMLWRMAGEPLASGNHFADVAQGQFYTTAVYWAANNGITQGVTATSFVPHQNLTREELATFLHRFAGTPTANTPVHWSNFVDRRQIAPFANTALRWATYHGIITGTSTTTLSPQGLATRAEGAAMLMRFDNLGGGMPEPSPSPQPTPPPPVNDPARAFEIEVLRLVNIERANVGASPFIWDDSLSTVARAHSLDMDTRNFFAHTCPSGYTFNDRINHGTRWYSGVGEVLVRFRMTPEQAVQAWMNSAAHRAILLDDWGGNWLHFVGIGYHDRHWTLKVTVGTY